jgi:hypothetical protein
MKLTRVESKRSSIGRMDIYDIDSKTKFYSMIIEASQNRAARAAWKSVAMEQRVGHAVNATIGVPNIPQIEICLYTCTSGCLGLFWDFATHVGRTAASSGTFRRYRPPF